MSELIKDNVVIISLDNIPNKDLTEQNIFNWQRQEWGKEGVAIIANSLKTLVAIKDGELVGCAALVKCDLPDFNILSPWLAGVYVIPNQRQHGIASELISQIENTAINYNFNEIFLYSSLVGFYENKNWKIVCKLPNSSDVIMKKFLDKER